MRKRLKPFSRNTLEEVKLSIAESVKLPKGEELNEWLAIHGKLKNV